MRTATALVTGLLFAATGSAAPTQPFASQAGRIVSLDARFDALVAPGSTIEVVASGHRWLEGPAWNSREQALYYSDIPANTVFRWTAATGTRMYLTPSGYSGSTPFAGREPGSNGLLFDGAGRLILCEHGDRRLTRLELDGSRDVLADRYQGQRLNSPNDVVMSASGDLYFTDPPFGLPDTFDDPARELDVQGVYRLRSDGRLELLIADIEAPNGIALSLDERILYVTDVGSRPAWLAFDLTDDGRATHRRVLADATPWTRIRRGGPDGLELDAQGHVFAAGPEGVFVFAVDGELLGIIETGVPTANLEWGEDGHTLFIAAATQILRLRTLTRAPERVLMRAQRSAVQPPASTLQPAAVGAPQ